MVWPSADANPSLLDLFCFGIGHVFFHLRQHLFSVVFGHVPRDFPLRHGVSLAKRSEFVLDAFVAEEKVSTLESVASGLRSFDL
jgi:hypothetical protein